MNKTSKPSINIQDGFLFHALRGGTELTVHLVTGEHVSGVLRRFDRFSLILETGGRDLLLYKHGIISIESDVEEEEVPPS